ncbi:hypothetical protein BaRGS_00036958, partial [Batillaria attramentaria]
MEPRPSLMIVSFTVHTHPGPKPGKCASNKWMLKDNETCYHVNERGPNCDPFKVATCESLSDLREQVQSNTARIEALEAAVDLNDLARRLCRLLNGASKIACTLACRRFIPFALRVCGTLCNIAIGKWPTCGSPMADSVTESNTT